MAKGWINWRVILPQTSKTNFIGAKKEIISRKSIKTGFGDRTRFVSFTFKKWLSMTASEIGARAKNWYQIICQF